jgi:RNA polymerase sigma-70 factor (ECF subfamily)
MAGPTEIRDEQLLQMMRAGDEEALTTLYRRRQGAVYRFVLAISGSVALAEDVTQEVFLALIRDNRGYDPARGSLSAYLLGMARHHALRFLKHDRTYVSIEPGASESADMTPLAGDDPHSILSRRETIQGVQQAILRLPAHYREAVVLCELNEMNYEDAASVLGCSVGTVRSRLHRGRALLIQKLTGGSRVETARAAVDPTRCPV